VTSLTKELEEKAMSRTYGMILRILALAIGIALIIIPISGSISNKTGFILAGIGIFAIAFESFLKYTYGLHK
jgi:hypothetical protein